MIIFLVCFVTTFLFLQSLLQMGITPIAISVSVFIILIGKSKLFSNIFHL